MWSSRASTLSSVLSAVEISTKESSSGVRDASVSGDSSSISSTLLPGFRTGSPARPPDASYDHRQRHGRDTTLFWSGREGWAVTKEKRTSHKDTRKTTRCHNGSPAARGASELRAIDQLDPVLLGHAVDVFLGDVHTVVIGPAIDGHPLRRS